MVRISVRLMAVFVTALACYACGGNSAPAPAASSTPSASATPASTSPGNEFGVVECDNYIKKYVACIDKLAPAAQGPLRQSLEQTQTAWKQAAMTEQGKATLASACKAMSDQSASAMRAQGCTW